jgi:hypothetical protein
LRYFRTIGICAAAIALVGAIAYGELVSDVRTPRANQFARFTIGGTYSISLVSYNQYMADMKEKYGERAVTTMPLDTGITEVTLDGKLLERRAEKRTLAGVIGLFVIGPDDAVKMRFPFDLAAKQDLSGLDRSLAGGFKKRFSSVPKQWLEFTDSEWTIDRCVSQTAGLGLGSIGEALRLREGTFCVVTWKGPQSGSMLISVNRADGDPWMRPFAKRICRSIVQAALNRFDPAAPDSPKYAACILEDRPDYGNARESLSVSAYSVEPGNTLAWMEQLSR